MRKIMTLLLAALAFVRFASAQSGEYEINQVDSKADTITATLNGQMRTFRVRIGVDTTINGVKATFDDLEPGMKVKITSAEPGLATRLAATGLRTRQAPTGNKPPLGANTQTARLVKASVRADTPNGFPIGDVQKGTRITIQYVSGKWKCFGHIANLNPDADDPKIGDANRLAVALPAEGGKPGAVLAIVPAGSSKRPFIYEADKDYPGLVLRIKDDDDTFAGSPGTTEWTVRIVPPAH